MLRPVRTVCVCVWVWVGGFPHTLELGGVYPPATKKTPYTHTDVWSIPVGRGEMSVYGWSGLDGFGRFWWSFWSFSVGRGEISVYGGSGLDGFGRF